MTAKPAAALSRICLYSITVTLTYVSASNYSLNRLNLWLLFFFVDFLMVRALLVKNYQINLLKKVYGIFSQFCVLDLIHVPFKLRHVCENGTYVKTNRSRSWSRSHEKKRTPELHSWKIVAPELEPCLWNEELRIPELCHFYDGSAALK